MNMKLEKKIELQAKIIHELQEENASLVERIKELERIVNDNEKIIDTAKTYRDEHEKCIASLNEISLLLTIFSYFSSNSFTVSET